MVDFSQLTSPRSLTDPIEPEAASTSVSTLPAPTAVSVEDEASSSTTNPVAVQRARQAARALPTSTALSEAARATVYKENGTPIRFSELFWSRKTIVVFPSHWACPHFQQYVKKLCNVNMAALGKAGFSLILVGQGSVHQMAAFQQAFPVPFSLYADADRTIYRALGMQLLNPALGAYDEHLQALTPRQAKKAGSKTSLRKGLLHLPPRAVGVIGSSRHVLGGVFVLGPGAKCSFAQRLTALNEYPDVHALLAGLGIVNPMLPLRQQIDPADRAKAELEVSDYWSPETPYYTNKPQANSGGQLGTQSFAPTSAVPKSDRPSGLLQESKQRLSIFLGRAKGTSNMPHAPLPSLGLPSRRPTAQLESMTNFSEPMFNPDPFAPGAQGLESELQGTNKPTLTAPWRQPADLEQRHRLRLSGSGEQEGEPHSTGVSQFLAPREHKANEGRLGRPGKISVRQLTTAALQPMEAER